LLAISPELGDDLHDVFHDNDLIAGMLTPFHLAPLDGVPPGTSLDLDVDEP